MADARLRTLADWMEDPSPSQSGSFAELQRSWIERAPRGIERTRDHTIGLVAQGDGVFEVYWLKQTVRMAIGRIHAHGCALIFFSPVSPNFQLPPAQVAARDRLARKLIPHSMGKPLPPNVIVRLGDFEFTAAFSHDGSRLAVWHEHDDNRLKIIDLTTGLVSTTFGLEPLHDLRSVSFTRDDASLAFGAADGKLRLWHLRPASGPIVLRGHDSKEAWAVAFSPDGKTLASAGDDHCIRLWNLDTGEQRAVLRGHDALVTSIAFSPDGQTLASASFDFNAPVILWDVATGTSKSVYREKIGQARSVSFSPDGRTVAAGGRELAMMLWDVHGGQLKAPFMHLKSCSYPAIFSPDGRMLASMNSNKIILTDLVSGESRSMQTGTEVFSLAYSPDGTRLFSGQLDGAISIWDVSSGSRTPMIRGHSSIVFGLAVSPDGRTLASAGEDRTVRVWDVTTGQELLRLTDCKARVNAVAFSPDGVTLAAADHTGAITLWRAIAGPTRSDIPGLGSQEGRNPGR